MICNTCGNAVDSIHRFCPKCGAPVQFQSPTPAGPPPYSPPQYAPPPMMGGPMPPPANKSGCGKIILIIAVIVLLLSAGVGTAIYFGYRYAEKALKSSEAYTVAVKALKENAEVKEQLGEITETGFPIGAYSQEANGSGKAAFVMSVHGSKGSGQYEVSLIRTNGAWQIERGVVKTADGETIRIAGRPVIYGDPITANRNTNTNTGDFGNANTRGAISGGILNGKALSLPKPAYPTIAKAARASGTVMVQVLVDEQGNVIAAHAVSGHPLLQAVAVQAARQAKFAPTKLSGNPVKVTGTIKYEFVPE